jgi:hypothetical protein
MRIGAELEPGELLLVQVAYDPNWRAYARGRRLLIRKDPLGQMLIEALPDRQQIELVFPMPIENQVGWLLFVSSFTTVVVLLITAIRRFSAEPPEEVSPRTSDSG